MSLKPTHNDFMINSSNEVVAIFGSQNSSSTHHYLENHQQTPTNQDRSISVQSSDDNTSSTSTYHSVLKDDNEKLNKRLLLLRDEYVKLQKKFLNLQTRYDHLIVTYSSMNLTKPNHIEQNNINLDSLETCSMISSSSGNQANDYSSDASTMISSTNISTTHFVQKIVDFIGSLYNNQLYSDLLIDYDDGHQQLHAHKFVLLFRSDKWSVPDLNSVDRLCFPEMAEEIADLLFRWVYKGHISSLLFDKSEDFIIELVKYAIRFELKPLVEQCEELLISYVQVNNCIYFYQTSEQLGLSRLYDYSAKLVAINWDSLVEKDFEKVSTPFLHKLFIEKSRYPLHKAIRIRNEDLIFLLLIDFDHQTSYKVNEFDNFGQIPLDLALRSGQLAVAKTLLKNQANIDALDADGWPLAHRYFLDKFWFAAKFLLEQGASVRTTNPDGDSLLHLCADYCLSQLQEDQDQMLGLAQMLLQQRCDVNIQNKLGNTALHRCISSQNTKLFDLLLDHHVSKKLNLDLELSNNNRETPLALALNVLDLKDDPYYAERLLSLQVSIDTMNPVNGDSLLNQCARNGKEKAAIFLVEHGANINLINNRGESILHLASSNGLKELVSLLLEKNVNCNLLTLSPFQWKSSSSNKNELSHENILSNTSYNHLQENALSDGDTDSVFNQTALHLAILGRHETIIKEILSFHDRSSRKGCLDSALLTPDLDVKNSRHQTPLSLAVELDLIPIAEMLIQAGADVNVKNEQGLSLLKRMIIDGNVSTAQFLLQHGVNPNELCPLTGESYLQCAIRHRRASIVELLCQFGADVKHLTTSCDSLLWEALKLYKEGHVEIASILIRYKSDPDGWHKSPDGGFFQTLLHRALDENNQNAAIFLIHSGCDIHCIRKPGPNNEGKDDCDGQTPLHMACSWGMANVVETLLEFKVDANLTDNEGKTPLHMAIINQNHQIIDMLLQYSGCDPYKTDNYGHTPFALAIKLKSRQTAQALCRRDPSVSEQRDGKGRNYFHLALQRNDYAAVLFLLDNKIDVNARIEDSARKAPIHLAAETGSEIILRTLVLAGSELNVLTMQNQTALHLAAELDKYQIAEILFDLGINADVQDSNGNTAFHLAAIHAYHNISRVLMERGIGSPSSPAEDDRRKVSLIDPRQTNNRGQNVCHCLAMSTNKLPAADIFEELITYCPDLNLDARDNDGNTALLLAYMNGNSKLCRLIVKEGASLGIRNNQGVSIFNHVMPTRQLLTSLLDSLVRMPAWHDGSECLECGQKFNITNRRHHCRHCGRELCSRCSSKEILIMKFQQDKKSIQSRVCELCYDVLTFGIFN